MGAVHSMEQDGVREQLNCCLIIPVHPAKANWLISFLNSVTRFRKEELPFRIVLAASNYPEYRFFNRLRPVLGLEKSIEIICVEDYLSHGLKYQVTLDRFRRNTDRCIVNVKKFVALHWAAENGYDWAVCMDCDVAAIGDIGDLFDLLLRNYAAKQYFGKETDVEHFLEINHASRSLFSELQQNALEMMAPGNAVYTWFFDVPFYSLRDVRSFFECMKRDYGSLELWFEKLNWHTFDHIVFLFWRCAIGDATLIEYGDCGDIPERLSFANMLRFDAQFGYRPVWMSASEYLKDPDITYTFSDLRLLYHFDRV